MAISWNDRPRVLLIGSRKPPETLPGEFIEGPAPALTELEDRAMAAYDPTQAGPGSVGVAARLDGLAALAIQDRTRSIVLEAEAEGPAAALALLGWVLGGTVGEAPFPVRRRETIGGPEQVAVLHGERSAAAFPAVGPRDSWLVFPGSFNPFHRGHARLAEIAHKLTGLPVDFELSVRNVDKPPLHFRAMAERLRGLVDTPDRPTHYGSAWLTSAPTFLEKARLFPGPVRFVVGMDTILRIGDPRYYQDEADCLRTLDVLAVELQVSFLAFPRNRGDSSPTGPEAPVELPARLRLMTRLVPIEWVRDVLDVSSSAIRAGVSPALPDGAGSTNLAGMGSRLSTFLFSHSEEHLMAANRTGEVTLKGEPLTLAGPKLKPGDKAPNFTCATGMKTSATLADTPAKARLFSVVPSLDTPVCSIQTKKFNDSLAAFGDKVAAYSVSVDTPFAIGRFCGEFKTCSFHPLSDTHDHSFGKNYGVQIEGLALPLLARAIFVVDPSNTITYVEIVPEIAQEPNYDAALAALKSAAG